MNKGNPYLETKSILNHSKEQERQEKKALKESRKNEKKLEKRNLRDARKDTPVKAAPPVRKDPSCGGPLAYLDDDIPLESSTSSSEGGSKRSPNPSVLVESDEDSLTEKFKATLGASRTNSNKLAANLLQRTADKRSAYLRSYFVVEDSSDDGVADITPESSPTPEPSTSVKSSSSLAHSRSAKSRNRGDESVLHASSDPSESEKRTAEQIRAMQRHLPRYPFLSMRSIRACLTCLATSTRSFSAYWICLIR